MTPTGRDSAGRSATRADVGAEEDGISDPEDGRADPAGHDADEAWAAGAGGATSVIHDAAHRTDADGRRAMDLSDARHRAGWRSAAIGSIVTAGVHTRPPAVAGARTGRLNMAGDTTTLPPTDPAATDRLDVLRSVEQRVLWLATAIVDHANRVRPNPSGLKVGGHQASSASIVSVMTLLWLEHLQPGDRVSVKPHASPVLHALNYLLGALDGAYLTTLREFGGLQSYPSRAKDPDAADYSTGSVGIGATAPLWGALARRYVGAHFGAGGTGRQYSLVGDAELDEGAVWEAIQDPMVAEFGEVVWIVDMNRQSLDRVVPVMGVGRRCGTASMPCPTPSTSGCCVAARPRSGNGCSAAATTNCTNSPTHWPTTRSTRPCATSAVTTWRRSTGRSRPSTTAGRR